MGIKAICFLVILGLLAVGSGFAQSAPLAKGQEGDIGRYQLFGGTYTSIDLKRQQTATHSGVFLLDTKTGKVKRYLNKIDEQGNYTETWMPTETEKP
jgi:hypothetical protein